MAYGDIDVQYIIEVMCCLDKEFQFIDCPGVVESKNGTVDYDAFYAKDYPNIPVRPCRPDVPIAYPQISHLWKKILLSTFAFYSIKYTHDDFKTWIFIDLHVKNWIAI